jgi:hypothetical protein
MTINDIKLEYIKYYFNIFVLIFFNIICVIKFWEYNNYNINEYRTSIKIENLYELMEEILILIHLY